MIGYRHPRKALIAVREKLSQHSDKGSLAYTIWAVGKANSWVVQQIGQMSCFVHPHVVLIAVLTPSCEAHMQGATAPAASLSICEPVAAASVVVGAWQNLS